MRRIRTAYLIRILRVVVDWLKVGKEWWKGDEVTGGQLLWIEDG